MWLVIWLEAIVAIREPRHDALEFLLEIGIPYCIEGPASPVSSVSRVAK